MSRNERTGDGGAVASVEQLVEKVIDVAEDIRQAGAAVAIGGASGWEWEITGRR